MFESSESSDEMMWCDGNGNNCRPRLLARWYPQCLYYARYGESSDLQVTPAQVSWSRWL